MRGLVGGENDASFCPSPTEVSTLSSGWSSLSPLVEHAAFSSSSRRIR